MGADAFGWKRPGSLVPDDRGASMFGNEAQIPWLRSVPRDDRDLTGILVGSYFATCLRQIAACPTALLDLRFVACGAALAGRAIYDFAPDLR